MNNAAKGDKGDKGDKGRRGEAGAISNPVAIIRPALFPRTQVFLLSVISVELAILIIKGAGG